jgi:hypothetical protein
VIASHMYRSDNLTTDASKYDSYETDKFDMTRLVGESRLIEKMKDAMCTR